MYKGSKRILSAILSAVLFTGGLLNSGLSSGTAYAAPLKAESVQWEEAEKTAEYTENTENVSQEVVQPESDGKTTEDGRWYVLGRPMTEEEKAEQNRLTKYYTSFLTELPQQEEMPQQEESSELGEEIQPGLSLQSMDVIQSADIPRQYSSRELGHTPAVRSQGSFGTCWAHAALACVEISLIKKGVIAAEDCDMSENQMIYYRHRPVVDPLGGTEGDYGYALTGNNIYQMYDSASYIQSNWGTLAAWMGPAPESELYEYNYLFNNHYEPTQGGILNTVEQAYGNRQGILAEYFAVSVWKPLEVKKAIMTYGAVGTHYYAGDECYNAESAAHYSKQARGQDHAVVLVGWNDNFSRENFIDKPENNGAWLARNTWGDDWGDGGYFWISYDDKSMAGAHIFNMVAPDKYDNNYHYDRAATDIGYISAPDGGKIQGANIFTIQKETEQLKAVQFYLMYANLKYSIQLYKLEESHTNPEQGQALLAKPLEGARKQSGLYTVDLDTPIEVVEGDRIAVSITYYSDDSTVSPALSRPSKDVSKPGQSIYRIYSQNQWGSWTDCETSGNLFIRLFTSNVSSESSSEHQHQWEENWSYNDTHHWHACDGEGSCNGAQATERAHGEHTGGTATCDARAVCSTCGKPYGYFNPEVHGSSQVRVNVVEATTTQKGYTGDVKCYGCGYVFEWGKETPKLTSDDLVIPGVDNLTYTFKALDDSEVSSHAVDKPKVIMFYGAKCYHCIDTLYDLTTYKVDGVDFCAVEVKQYSKDVINGVIENQLGEHTDYITFCYDESYGAAAARTAYEQHFNGMTSSSLPVLFYIDANNKIRHMTSGTQSSRAVKQNLALYCNLAATGLNVDNPGSLEFTSYDGKPMSMTANGKPKVLIFHQTGAGAENTLRSIGSKELPGVDIYAINFWHGDDASVKAYIENLVGENSHILAGRSDQSMEELYKYLTAAGESTSRFDAPVICYIDAQNKLQLVTQGEASFETIKTSLMLNCGYQPEAGEGGDNGGQEGGGDQGQEGGDNGGQEGDGDQGQEGGDNGGQEGGGDQGQEGDGEQETVDFTLTTPTQTTYFVGESINTAGGKLNLTNGQSVDISQEMISVSTLENEGIVSVDVTYEEVTKQFNILVVKKPTGLTGVQDEKLSTVIFSESSLGTFTWSNGEEIMAEVGEQSYSAVFTPANTDYSARQDLQLVVRVQEKPPVEPPVDPPVIPEEPAVEEFRVGEIVPLVYNGTALKPKVEVYDGNTLLKLNKDYKVTYKNNINVNSVAVGEEFKEELPTVIITGKGNYSGTIKVNFTILPVELADAEGNENTGVSLAYNSHLTLNASKEQAVFKSLKVKKALKEGQDYTLSLSPKAEGTLGEQNLAGSKIPAGMKGMFTLTLTGKGNYSGTITKTIFVEEKAKLLNSAVITLGKNLKSIDFNHFHQVLGGKLTTGYYDSTAKVYYEAKDGILGQTADKNTILTVKNRKTELMEGRDYTVTYKNVSKTGTATLTITGKGEYVGSKSVTFKLTGKAFKASTVSITGLEDKVYSGKPVEQEKLILTYQGESTPLEINKDYQAVYSKNLDKGTATVTFTAMENSGYQGSFKKTFKITAQPIVADMQEESTKNIIVEYKKSGAKPVEEILLTNKEGIALVYGKDYTLIYKNNKEAAEKNGLTGPYAVVQGKGNYNGKLEIPYTIKKASLSGDKISISIKPVAYSDKKADAYEYRPVITVKDEGKVLSTKTDYRVTYENNTQKAYKEYYLSGSVLSKELCPRVKVEAIGKNYETSAPIYLELPIYTKSLTSKNLYVVISEINYTGNQCTPEVSVYYAPKNNASAAKGITKEEDILALGFVKLETTEYQLEYGTNILTGKNKGVVKVTGKGSNYGGSVSFKFTIAPKEMFVGVK